MSQEEIKGQDNQMQQGQSTQERNWAVFCHLRALLCF